MNENLKYLSEYDEDKEKNIITGHEKGEIYVWNLRTRDISFLLTQYTYEILKIIPTVNNLVVISDSSFINFYDINLQMKRLNKVIDTTQIFHKFHSYDVHECLYLQK